MYSDKYASLASLLHRLAGSDGSGFVSHSPVWDRGNVWPWSWSRAPLRSVDWTDLTQNYLLVLFLDWSPPSLLKLRHYKLSFLRIRELWYDELGSFFVIFIFFIFFCLVFLFVKQMEKISWRIPVRLKSNRNDYFQIFTGRLYLFYISLVCWLKYRRAS